jgi:hypothetical protein
MKERTAMDEGKGYDYGASRASAILHRMFEAGYGSSEWEEVAQLYAGWDTDLSPTIQTRTVLPGLPTFSRNKKRLGQLLWAARVRATRTRREAWACFLACENAAIPGQEVFLAMFEKVAYREAEEAQDTLDDADMSLPGDMKEVVSESTSARDLIHVAEPVPSWEQLYHRMKEKGIHPTGRLLAFLLETSPNFALACEMMSHADVQRLVNGSILRETNMDIPEHLLAAFIRCLCRFGRFTQIPSLRPRSPPQEEHEHRLMEDRLYRLEYAYTLLIRCLPRHRPTWTAYIRTLLFSPWDVEIASKLTAQYRILCEILDKMDTGGIYVDDEQFKMVCIAYRHIVQGVFQGSVSSLEARDVLASGCHRIRTMFRDLTMHAPSQTPKEQENPLPARIPGPVVLHAYVRALGVFQDYEGLYSFTTWASNNHAEVTTRAAAQRGGPRNMRRLLMAIRAGIDGLLGGNRGSAPAELRQLVKGQIEDVEEWGGWPSEQEMELYMRKKYGSR